MDIMHACYFYTFPMAKKRKEKRKSKQRLVYLKTLSHTCRRGETTYAMGWLKLG
jgi:hypothetical protein